VKALFSLSGRSTSLRGHLSLSATTYKDISRSPMSRRGSSFVVTDMNRTVCRSDFGSLLLCYRFLRLALYNACICGTWVKCCFCLLAEAEGITEDYIKQDHAWRLHYRSTQSPHGLPLACMHDILLQSYTPHVNRHLFRASMTMSCKWTICCHGVESGGERREAGCKFIASLH